ncbi:unnamed protein product [Toxocara canis]|uniref:Uncharacterized protein n=1 Tax=Toxocara canis TaxID=6265 RepID=A0A183UW00_TOXCA|nr:unnamed protein product [Toxocara canis]
MFGSSLDRRVLLRVNSTVTPPKCDALRAECSNTPTAHIQRFNDPVVITLMALKNLGSVVRSRIDLRSNILKIVEIHQQTLNLCSKACFEGFNEFRDEGCAASSTSEALRGTGHTLYHPVTCLITSRAALGSSNDHEHDGSARSHSRSPSGGSSQSPLATKNTDVQPPSVPNERDRRVFFLDDPQPSTSAYSARSNPDVLRSVLFPGRGRLYVTPVELRNSVILESESTGITNVAFVCPYAQLAAPHFHSRLPSADPFYRSVGTAATNPVTKML